MTWTETDKVIKGAKLKNTTGWIAELKSNIREAADYNSIDGTQLLYTSMAVDTPASSKNYIWAYHAINSISEALVCGADNAGNYSTRYSSHKNSVNNSNQTGNKSADRGEDWSGDNNDYDSSEYDYCSSHNPSYYDLHCPAYYTSDYDEHFRNFDLTVAN